MNPAMISTLAQMIYTMGGEDHGFLRHVPAVWGVVLEQPRYYVNRLTALHIELRRRAFGKSSQNALRTVKELHRTFPENPLFSWAYGHICESYELSQNGKIPLGIHNDDEYIYERAFIQGVPRER